MKYVTVYLLNETYSKLNDKFQSTAVCLSTQRYEKTT